MHLQAAHGRLANAAQQPKQSRLPRAICTDDPHHLASRNFKGHIAQSPQGFASTRPPREVRKMQTP